MWKHIVLIGGGTPLLPSSWSAVQPRALPESLTPTYSGPTPPCWPAIPVPPLSSYFLSVFLSLINQCQAVQQQGQHSFPGCLLSSSCMSLCADPPPPPARAATVILSHGRRAETPGPHDMKGSQAEWGGGEKKKEEEAFLSLQSFLRLATGEKKGSLHHLHNSRNTQGKKQPIEW